MNVAPQVVTRSSDHIRRVLVLVANVGLWAVALCGLLLDLARNGGVQHGHVVAILEIIVLATAGTFWTGVVRGHWSTVLWQCSAIGLVTTLLVRSDVFSGQSRALLLGFAVLTTWVSSALFDLRVAGVTPIVNVRFPYESAGWRRYRALLLIALSLTGASCLAGESSRIAGLGVIGVILGLGVRLLLIRGAQSVGGRMLAERVVATFLKLAMALVLLNFMISDSTGVASHTTVAILAAIVGLLMIEGGRAEMSHLGGGVESGSAARS